MSVDDQQQFGLFKRFNPLEQASLCLPQVTLYMLEMPPLFAQRIHSFSTRTWPGANAQLALPVPQSTPCTPLRVCPSAPTESSCSAHPPAANLLLQSTKSMMCLPRPGRGWGHHKGFVLPGEWGQQERAGPGTREGVWDSGCRLWWFKKQKAPCKCAEIHLLFSPLN